LAYQRASYPQGISSPRPQKRKSRDYDYFVEETLLFTYTGATKDLESPNGSPTTITIPRSPISGAQSLVDLQSLIQKMEELRCYLLIEVHHLSGCSKASLDSSDEESSTGDHSSSDEEEHEDI
jgi:hypothetical protein